MKKIVKRILIALGVVLVICVILLSAHLIVNKIDLGGLLKSMHGAR